MISHDITIVYRSLSINWGILSSFLLQTSSKDLSLEEFEEANGIPAYTIGYEITGKDGDGNCNINMAMPQNLTAFDKENDKDAVSLSTNKKFFSFPITLDITVQYEL